MSVLLMTRRAGGAAAAGEGGGGALALTLSGSPQTLSYTEPLGVWPDGSARTLFVQFTRSMTNGTPVSGTLTVTNRSIAVDAHRWGSGTASTLVSFAVPLQSGDLPSANFAAFTTGTWTDDSATWSNANAATWFTGGDGIPEGVLSPTSASHLCSASSFGVIVPQATQPVFTGSAAVDTALTNTYTTTALAWDGTLYGPASYNRTIALYQLYCRTADVQYLKAATAFASRMRVVYWAANFNGLPEWQQATLSFLWLRLMRRDTGARDGLRVIASNAQLNLASFHQNLPRFMTQYLRGLVAVFKLGEADTNNVYHPSTSGTYRAIMTLCINVLLDKGSTKLTSTDDRLTFPFYAEDGVTVRRGSYAYAAGMLLDAFLDVTSVLPAGTERTNVLTQISASIARLRTSFSGTSAAGHRTYNYSDTALYYDARPATLTAGYTAGSTSMSVNIPGSSWPAGLFSAGTRFAVGGVDKATTANFTTDGSGNATVTLESGGFASSYSNGQAITVIRDGASNSDYETVDLNGFYAHLAAYRSYAEASSTDANEARALYTPIGAASGGPFLSQNKQWDESFHRSQMTLAYLQLSGL
jgi:hypothetical protein